MNNTKAFYVKNRMLDATGQEEVKTDEDQVQDVFMLVQYSHSPLSDALVP